MLKRIFDLLFSITVLLVVSPLLLIIAIAVRWKLGRPVLYRQQRPGLHGNPFTIYKFRTMTDLRNANGELLPDDQRLPPFGRLLRRTSLDELPEFWNVFRGDMSVVGPRPLLMQYLPRYSDEQRRRHLVKPGLTGWAQIHGRNAVSWNERFVLDVWYVDHQNLWLDFKIIAITIATIFKAEGITAEGHVTMPEFTGKEGS